jgi:hypothetical protein
MRRIGYRLIAALIAIGFLVAAGEAPPTLRRGINMTHWFRYPPDRNPSALRSYVDDAVLEELKRLGFTFIRLPVQSSLLSSPDAILAAIARVEQHGLAAVVALFPDDWQLESNTSDRSKLISAWRSLAVSLRHFDPRLTFPEILNEPVFSTNPGAWSLLQHQALVAIREALPKNTIVLTGADWGSVTGLLALPPEQDPNVVYSFHLYEPAELTSLDAYRPGLDAAAMALLPFPADDESICAAQARNTTDPPTADLIRFYCAQHWDAARVGARIASAGDWAKRNHVAVIAGEFGASQHLNTAARLTWLKTVRMGCEEQGFGWALWGYDDVMGFGITAPSGRAQIATEVLLALGLSRPANSAEASRAGEQVVARP